MIHYHVGQKVVCVDASECPGAFPLKEGAIYTIRWVGKTPAIQASLLRAFGISRATLSVRLAEIDRRLPVAFGSQEPVYRASRFRPLIETDISVFTAMLNSAPRPARQTEDADA